MPSGLYLAMDTSKLEGSVALGLGDPGVRLEVLAQTSLKADEEHAAHLAPRVEGLLQTVDCEPRDLSGIVAGAGPGSFTGVRIGAATAAIPAD